MEYLHGEVCEGETDYQRRTVITFTCDPSQETGSPKFVGEDKFCTYSFTWATKYACPFTAATVECKAFGPDKVRPAFSPHLPPAKQFFSLPHTQSHTPLLAACAPPQTGKMTEYDLSPLINNRRNYVAAFSRDNSTTEQYQINVCRPLVPGSHHCNASQAACELDGNVRVVANAASPCLVPARGRRVFLHVPFVFGSRIPVANVGRCAWCRCSPPT